MPPFPHINRLVLAVTLTALTAPCPAQPDIHYKPGSTRRINQLTGDWDRPYGIPTTNQTDTQALLYATDLGSTFEHKGQLVFLFGDTWGGRDGLLDTMGFSDSTSPWDVEMTIPVSYDGIWRPMLPPGLNYAEFRVPSHGISVNGDMYVVFTQSAPTGELMKRSWMIRSTNDGASWQTLYQLDNSTIANPTFVNVWLEERDGYIYMFGCGEYRQSSPMLARMPKSEFPAKSSWRYYAGKNTQGDPVWSPSIGNAQTLFHHNQLGEFSCCWIDTLNCWVMLYNSGSPRGITMRTAAQPWGPWSSPRVIMEPTRDQAYGYYMHVSSDVAQVDFFSDFGRESEWGGEYGPYLIPRFTSGTPEECELFYTLSTWNPYQVVMMRSVVGTESFPQPPATTNHTLGHDLWNRYPEDIADEFMRDGRPNLTTYTTGKGDDSQGWMWQMLPPGTVELEIGLHGGHSDFFILENASPLPETGDVAAVSLALRTGQYGRVAMHATGVNDNAEVINWNGKLRNVDNARLSAVVIDDTNAPWGFISFSDMRIKVQPPPAAVSDWTLY